MKEDSLIDLKDAVRIASEKMSEFEKKIHDKISEMIGIFSNIMRFIDTKIVIETWFSPMANNNMYDYYDENGILIYSRVRNKNKRIEKSNPEHDYFPNDFPSNIITEERELGGIEVYLTRSGKIIKFTRTGSTIHPNNIENVEPWDIQEKLIDPKELSIKEYIQIDEDMEKPFIEGLKRAIVRAIDQNENKAYILKKVIKALQAYEFTELPKEEKNIQEDGA